MLQRTGIRTAFAYLRIGADPGRIRRQDVAETIRRPSRGIAPMVVEMLTNATTSVAEIRRLAARLSGRDVPKVERYADDLDAVAKACARSTAEALRAIGVGIGLGDTMDILDSSRREADRSTHTDDLFALESVAGLHPGRGQLRAVVAGGPGPARATGPAVLLSTVHRIKGREWGHVSSTARPTGSSPTDSVTTKKESAGSSTWRSLGPGDRSSSSPTPRPPQCSWPSSTAPDPTGGPPRRPGHARLELDRPTDEPSPAGRRATRRGGSDTAGSSARIAGRRHADDARRRDRRGPTVPTVGAVEGLVVEDRGNVGAIVEVTATHAVIAVGVARVGIALGSEVSVGGRTVSLVAPEDAVEMTPESEAAEQELRNWRSASARQEGVPAYVILNDQELVGIAVRFPGTLKELATCKGIDRSASSGGATRSSPFSTASGRPRSTRRATGAR